MQDYGVSRLAAREIDGFVAVEVVWLGVRVHVEIVVERVGRGY